MPSVTMEDLVGLAREVLELTGATLGKSDEALREMRALRLHLGATAQDVRSIRMVLERQDLRLERIEGRVERLKPASA